MARTRLLKPDFFTDADLFDAEQASGLPLRLAYEGLWCQADRRGRFKWKPRELKLHILPFDVVDFAAVLDALASAGFIRRYEVGGEAFGYIPTFHKHQTFHRTERDSTLPAPDGEQDGPGEAPVRAPLKPRAPTGAHTADAVTVTGTVTDTGKDIAAAPRSSKKPARKASRTETQSTGEGRTTWLTPLAGPWDKRFGEGTFDFGKWAKRCQPFHGLLSGRPPGEVAQRFECYLDSLEDTRFASPSRFCETYDAWVPPAEDYTVPVNGWMSPELERLTRPA